MLKRKEMKKRAKQVVKKHYWLLLILCLGMALFGTEFSSTLNFVRTEHTEMDSKTKENKNAIQYNSRLALDDILNDALDGHIDEAYRLANKLKLEEITQNSTVQKGIVLGRSRGVLADLVNNITSGYFLVVLLSAIESLGLSKNIIIALFIILSAIVLFLVWMFIKNVLQTILRRMVLECRLYDKVPFQRILFLAKVKKWCKVAVTLAMEVLFQTLWACTIIGGVIKRYSYYLVPYIVAENPDIGWKEAITLSRKMMDGYKWECFKLEMSFLLWDMAGFLTLGISDLFYTNAYKIVTYTEFYVQVRLLAKKNCVKGIELLNDLYLYEKADALTLDEAYIDVLFMDYYLPKKTEHLKGIKGFMARNLGITLYPRKEELQLEKMQYEDAKFRLMQDALTGKGYPSRLFPIPEKEKDVKAGHINYMRRYSPISLILIFFAFCVTGWIWEVSLHLVADGTFVNRGMLHGPWIPIYGAGSLLILTLLYRLRRRPILEFTAIVILSGIIEYMTSYYTECLFNGKKWWDYQGYFLNLDGRICAEGLLTFGIGGMILVYLIAPMLDNYLRKMKTQIAVPLCVILLSLFMIDQAYSFINPNTGHGITDYVSKTYIKTNSSVRG
ncbi:DUF975 family protein [Firmicutes bacterium AM41-5BH]|nr:DUF975 family protein [Firmicutes bacterium AM41-5BH]